MTKDENIVEDTQDWFNVEISFKEENDFNSILFSFVEPILIPLQSIIELLFFEGNEFPHNLFSSQLVKKIKIGSHIINTVSDFENLINETSGYLTSENFEMELILKKLYKSKDGEHVEIGDFPQEIINSLTIPIVYFLTLSIIIARSSYYHLQGEDVSSETLIRFILTNENLSHLLNEAIYSYNHNFAKNNIGQIEQSETQKNTYLSNEPVISRIIPGIFSLIRETKRIKNPEVRLAYFKDNFRNFHYSQLEDLSEKINVDIIGEILS